MSKIGRTLRSLYFRSRAFRAFMNLLLRFRRKNRLPDLAHLASYDEEMALGPVQREEALLLFALCRMTRPRVVVEFGFAVGHGTFNLLRALPKTSRIYSFDIGSAAEEAARRNFSGFENFRFIAKSQCDIGAADFDYQPVDFVFLDASHELALNQKTFLKLLPLLSNKAIIAVHDTGTWARNHMNSQLLGHTAQHPAQWITANEFAHAPGEREFVDWVAREQPDFSVVHLHSLQTIRHGITLLQRRSLLAHEGAQEPKASVKT